MIRIILLFLILLLSSKGGKADTLFNKVSEFILQNEVSGVWAFKAYKDTTWTICNGITYTFEKKKLPRRKCKLIDKNNIAKGYICAVNKGDIFTYEKCKKQEKLHIDYIINKLSNKYLIGRSGTNWWNKLDDRYKVILIDVLFNYGETKKEVKELLEATMELCNIPNEKNKFNFLDKMIRLCEPRTIQHKKYEKGQMNRCNRRIMQIVVKKK